MRDRELSERMVEQRKPCTHTGKLRAVPCTLRGSLSARIRFYVEVHILTIKFAGHLWLAIMLLRNFHPMIRWGLREEVRLKDFFRRPHSRKKSYE